MNNNSNNNYTDRELFEAIYEVRDRVIRIEEALKRTEKMEIKIEENSKQINEVRLIAKEALELAKTNKENITSSKATTKWVIGLLVTFILAVVSAFIGLK